tara:strand:- start:61 stop:1443 length:1383 start_codon:yes stop_codon:yes gene_type:complete
MSITSLVNTKGLSKSAVTPVGSSSRMARDPWAPNYELIIYGGPGAKPYAVSDKIKTYIDSVTFEDNADQFDKMTITMSSQIDDFGGGEINSLIDSRLFTEGHIVEIQMGFGGSLFTVGAADIVSISPTFPQDGPPTLTIVGYDLLHRSSRRKPRSGVTYTGFRDSQIASIIGSRNGFDIKTNEAASFAGIKRVAGVKPRAPQKKGVSDYTYLKKIADINGFDLFSKWDTKRRKFGLFFQPPPTKNNREVFVFAYNEGDLGYNDTLLSFTPKLEAHDQATDFEVFVSNNKTSSSTTHKPMDRLSVEEAKLPKADTEVRFTGANIGPRGGKKPKTEDGIQVAFKAYGRSFAFPPHKRFKNEADAKKSIEEFIKRQKEGFITGEGRLIGKEVLQSRQVHRLEGISEQFSGRYYFTKVTHTMSKSEGYFTDFSARKVIEDVVVQATPQLSLSDTDKRFRKLKGI